MPTTILTRDVSSVAPRRLSRGPRVTRWETNLHVRKEERVWRSRARASRNTLTPELRVNFIDSIIIKPDENGRNRKNLSFIGSSEFQYCTNLAVFL